MITTGWEKLRQSFMSVIKRSLLKRPHFRICSVCFPCWSISHCIKSVFFNSFFSWSFSLRTILECGFHCFKFVNLKIWHWRHNQITTSSTAIKGSHYPTAPLNSTYWLQFHQAISTNTGLRKHSIEQTLEKTFLAPSFHMASIRRHQNTANQVGRNGPGVVERMEPSRRKSGTSTKQ